MRKHTRTHWHHLFINTHTDTDNMYTHAHTHWLHERTHTDSIYTHTHTDRKTDTDCKYPLSLPAWETRPVLVQHTLLIRRWNVRLNLYGKEVLIVRGAENLCLWTGLGIIDRCSLSMKGGQGIHLPGLGLPVKTVWYSPDLKPLCVLLKAIWLVSS